MEETILKKFWKVFDHFKSKSDVSIIKWRLLISILKRTIIDTFLGSLRYLIIIQMTPIMIVENKAVNPITLNIISLRGEHLMQRKPEKW